MKTHKSNYASEKDLGSKYVVDPDAALALLNIWAKLEIYIKGT